ncbi:YybH family protein [Tautonia plasticadhaerens]|uniref:SnoaL-like domain protein n=1 Tax=Tautonia plasticadhaerens TaxID=2527974 RepID=A0A518H3B8_9BACT|nr:SgcJ/EcaC family oxidoreductase [Tautonia plasticadhaerens]QDV35345.1 SnoaL-like domain protein [Tautonia plasticadhaerens]
MRRCVPLLMAVITLSAASSALADDEAMEAARSVAEGYAKAVNERDAEAVAAFYVPDADRVVVAGVEVVDRSEGRDSIAGHFRRLFEGNEALPLDSEVESARLVAPATLAYELFWELTGLPSGEPMRGRSIIVASEREGRWQNVTDYVLIPVRPG